MILKRVGVLSVAKVMACIYFVMGLIGGAFLSFMSLVGASLGPRGDMLGGALFGLLAIIFLPLLYGALGGLFGALGAALYNLVARLFGGIEMEFEGHKPESWSGASGKG